jgi:hypothetical protein
MGKNTVSQVPHDIAALLGLANPFPQLQEDISDERC